MAEPRATRCPFCDFGTGRRGMDRCVKCDGTGSVFVTAGPRYFPNTREGYTLACEASGATPVYDGDGP